MDCQLTLGWALQPHKNNWESSFVSTFYLNEDEAKKSKPKKKTETIFLRKLSRVFIKSVVVSEVW